jgi:hypothetical protein
LAWTDASPGSTCASLLANTATINPKCGTQPEQQIIAGVDGNFAVTDATCTAPGSITVSPFGGKSSYTVTLLGTPNTVRTGVTSSTTFSNLAAGTYNFTITDANNCTVTRSRTITTTGALPTPAATVIQPTCTVATATVTVTSPASGVTYTLTQAGTTKYTASNGVFSLVVPGVYGLKASNGTCTSTGNNVTVNAQPATPSAPTVSVVNNCDGSSDLTAGNYTGSLLWSNGATTASIHVTNAATYTVTQTNVDGCTSLSGSGTSAPKTTPSAPTVSVVNNCDGSSDLTAGNYTGSLLWSNGASTASIHVTNAAVYTVTQTNGDGCTSASGSGTSAPRTTPPAPTVSVVNNCDGSSDLTAGNYTGTLLWSNGASTASIHVTNAAVYTVTQTNGDGCTSLSGSGTSAPRTTPSAPTVSVVNNCDGSSDLTAGNYTGSLLWSNGATTASIHVTNAATYTVTQTNGDGCTSLSGSGTSAPKTTPAAPTANTIQPSCATPAGTISVTSGITGLSFSINSTDPAAFTNTTGVFSGLSAGTYSIRSKNSSGCISDPVSKTIVAAPSAPAIPVVGVKQAASCSSSSIVLEVSSPLGSDFEYSNNNGAWQTSAEFTIKAGDGYNIKARRISDNTCISEASSCAAETTSGNRSPQPSATNTSTKTITTAISQTELSGIVVKAFPNPYNDKVKLVVTSPVAGNGSLEVVNMLGQKIKTVFQGHILAGSQSFEMSLPNQQHSTLIYIFRMGDKQITGKLLKLNQ